MTTTIQIRHFNRHLAIGLQDVRNAWYMPAGATPLLLLATVYQGQLYYRLPHSGKRISYRRLKKDLQKVNITISLPACILPF